MHIFLWWDANTFTAQNLASNMKANLKAAVVMLRRIILSKASLYTAFVMTLGFHTRRVLQSNGMLVLNSAILQRKFDKVRVDRKPSRV